MSYCIDKCNLFHKPSYHKSPIIPQTIENNTHDRKMEMSIIFEVDRPPIFHNVGWMVGWMDGRMDGLSVCLSVPPHNS